jgi:hypothetical protein
LLDLSSSILDRLAAAGRAYDTGILSDMWNNLDESSHAGRMLALEWIASFEAPSLFTTAFDALMEGLASNDGEVMRDIHKKHVQNASDFFGQIEKTLNNKLPTAQFKDKNVGADLVSHALKEFTIGTLPDFLTRPFMQNLPHLNDEKVVQQVLLAWSRALTVSNPLLDAGKAIKLYGALQHAIQGAAEQPQLKAALQTLFHATAIAFPNLKWPVAPGVSHDSAVKDMAQALKAKDSQALEAHIKALFQGQDSEAGEGEEDEY